MSYRIFAVNLQCFKEITQEITNNKITKTMKKIVFMAVAIAAVSFASCGNKTEAGAAVDSAAAAVDSTLDSAAAAVDSTVAAAVDSTAAAATAAVDSAVAPVAQ